MSWSSQQSVAVCLWLRVPWLPLGYLLGQPLPSGCFGSSSLGRCFAQEPSDPPQRKTCRHHHTARQLWRFLQTNTKNHHVTAIKRCARVHVFTIGLKLAERITEELGLQSHHTCMPQQRLGRKKGRRKGRSANNGMNWIAHRGTIHCVAPLVMHRHRVRRFHRVCFQTHTLGLCRIIVNTHPFFSTDTAAMTVGLDVDPHTQEWPTRMMIRMASPATEEVGAGEE